MIQRIQTLWLCISLFLSVFLFNGGIVNFTGRDGQKYFTGFSGIYKINESGSEIIRNSIPSAVLIISIFFLSVVTIFFYKLRRIQKITAYLLVVLSFCLMALILYNSFIAVQEYECHVVPGIKLVFPVLIMISAILAARGITKDDALVKSYDRLR